DPATCTDFAESAACLLKARISVGVLEEIPLPEEPPQLASASASATTSTVSPAAPDAPLARTRRREDEAGIARQRSRRHGRQGRSAGVTRPAAAPTRDGGGTRPSCSALTMP